MPAVRRKHKSTPVDVKQNLRGWESVKSGGEGVKSAKIACTKIACKVGEVCEVYQV